jgi:hypothetical protein
MLHLTEDFKLEIPQLSESVTRRVTEALLPAGGSNALEVTFAAIHEGLTRNNTNYSKDGLTAKTKNAQGHPSGLESWTVPYNTPILKDHESVADNAIGRVNKAEWVEGTGKAKGYVKLTAQITNPAAIEKFVRGEYQTGSIGMDIDTAKCSICEADFMKGWAAACSHERGKWYKKGEKGSDQEGQFVETEAHDKGARRAHVNIGNVWAREYSVVATPSDAYSRILSMEITEAVMSGESFTSPLNLLEGAIIRESVTPADPVTRSVGELMPYFHELLKTDVLGTYFWLCIRQRLGGEMACSAQEEVLLTELEIAKVRESIRINHEHLEAELLAIENAVLSNEESEKLPDSSFALIESINDQTVRLFPYRDATSVVDAEALLTALTWIRSTDECSIVNRETAVRKLMAAARKAKIGQVDRAQEIETAKELLVAEKFTVLTAEELASLTPVADETEIQNKLDTIEADLVETNTILLERETEIEELLEQIDTLTKQAGTATTTRVTELAQAVSSLLELDEEAAQGVLEGLTSSTDMVASAITLIEAHVSELKEQIVIATPVGKNGLNLGSRDDELSTEKAEVTSEVLIGAMLGRKRDRQALLGQISKLK